MKPVRPSRHPLQVWLMVSLLTVAFAQILWGPAPGPVTTALAGTTQTMLSLIMLMGAMLCLIAVIIPDVWISSGVELSGLIMLGTVFGVYSYVIFTVISPPTVVSLGFAAGLSIGVAHRGVQVVLDARRIVKHSSTNEQR